VIGRGQSACESAALLHEAGADVDIICRGPLVWNADSGTRGALRKGLRSLLGKALIPPSQSGRSVQLGCRSAGADPPSVGTSPRPAQ